MGPGKLGSHDLNAKEMPHMATGHRWPPTPCYVRRLIWPQGLTWLVTSGAATSYTCIVDFLELLMTNAAQYQSMPDKF